MITRQQQLDAINLKIARTSQSEEGTGCFLPVLIGDVLDFGEEIEDFYKPEKDRVLTGYNHMGQPIYETVNTGPSIFDSIIEKWHAKREPLDRQSDDCISYIYNLL